MIIAEGEFHSFIFGCNFEGAKNICLKTSGQPLEIMINQFSMHPNSTANAFESQSRLKTRADDCQL